MSYTLLGLILRYVKLPAPEKPVLAAMAYHANDQGGDIWPSNKTIALETGLSIRTVQRTIDCLTQNGTKPPYVSVIQQGGSRRGARAIYRIHYERLPKFDTEQPMMGSQNPGTVTLASSSDGVSARPINGDNRTHKGDRIAVKGRQPDAQSVLTRQSNHPSMNSAELSNKWNVFHSEIRKLVSNHTYETWIRPLKPAIECSPTVLTVQAPNDSFTFALLKFPEHFRTALERAGFGRVGIKLFYPTAVSRKAAAR